MAPELCRVTREDMDMNRGAEAQQSMISETAVVLTSINMITAVPVMKEARTGATAMEAIMARVFMENLRTRAGCRITNGGIGRMMTGICVARVGARGSREDRKGGRAVMKETRDVEPGTRETMI